MKYITAKHFIFCYVKCLTDAYHSPTLVFLKEHATSHSKIKVYYYDEKLQIKNKYVAVRGKTLNYTKIS
jgi:hypothetical protein